MPKSKTQKKKEAESLQKLGEGLLKLSAEQLKDIELPAEIFDAVVFSKTIKSRGALRRQMQYIGTLMRNIDTTPVREAIHNIDQGLSTKTAAFKETEKWRDELIAGDITLMEDILKKFPASDRQQLAQLVRNAVKERDNNKPPKAFRALFRYLVKIRSGTD
jgi:ribosome-associated protein